MSNEIEVGGVVLRVRAVATGVNEVITQMQTAFNRVGAGMQQVIKSSDAAAAKARDTVSAAVAANKAVDSFGSNTSGIDKYSLKLDTLNAKYDAQQQKVQKLGNELDIMANQYAEMMSKSGSGTDFDLAEIFPDMTAQFDKELAKLDELRNAIRLTEQAQEAAIQKQEQLNQKMADRTARADFRIGMTTAAQSIRVVSNAAGGAAGQLGIMASEIIYLKQMMNSAASASAAMGVAISGGLMLGVTAITAIVTAMKRAQDEARQAAAEAAKSFKLVSDEIASINKNIAILKSQTASIEDVAAAKQELAKTFPQMVTLYDSEGKAILKTVEALEKELEYRKAIQEAENKVAAASAQTSADEYGEAWNKVFSGLALRAGNRNISEYVSAYGIKGIFKFLAPSPEEEEKDIKEWEVEMLKKYDTLKINFTAKLSELGGKDLANAFAGQLGKWLVPDDEGKIDVDKIARQMSDKYNEIIKAVSIDISKAAPEVQAAIQSLYAAAASGTIPVNEVADQVRRLVADPDLMTRVKEFEALASKITGGEATNAEIEQYNSLLEKMKQAVSGNAEVFKQLSNASLASAEDLIKAAAKTKAAESSYLDAAKSVSDLFNNLQNVNDELKDLGAMKAAAAALETGKSAKNYGEALAYVADKYDVTKEEAAGMAETLKDEISIKEALTEATIMAAQAQVEFQIMTVEAMRDAGTIVADKAETMINALNKVSEKYAELLNPEGGLNTNKIPVKLPSNVASSVNEALQKQLSLLEHKKRMDDLTYAEEIAWLKRIRDQHARTGEERRDLDEKLYAARKAQMQAELDHKRAMDQLTLAEEIKAVEGQLGLYRKGTAERIALEEQLYTLKKEKAQQDYELQVYYGKLNLQQQEAYIKQQIKQYKAGTDARIELEKQLYDIQKQLRDQNAQQLDQIAEGIVTALRNRYEEQRKIEENRIRESIDAWRSWAEEQVSVIEEQIKALDDLTKEEDRAEEERKKRRKIAALEQQLLYETDAYNRKKLQDEIAKAQQELQNWLTRIEREDQKKALQEQIDAINQRASEEQAKLEEQLEANNAYFDELTKSYNLQAEAQRIVMRNNQTEIINLIKAFAPEYNATGQTLGEQLVDGFTSKVKNIEAWFNSINSKIQEYQNIMANVANTAADAFWQSRGAAPTSMQTAPATPAPPASIVINFNQPVESPSEVARALQSTLEQMYQIT